MPLTPKQIDRISRSFSLFSQRPADLRAAFENEMATRGAICTGSSTRLIAELFDLAANASRTNGAAFANDVVDRASWGAEEHALLAAVADLCDYAWTQCLEQDWSTFVSCAVQRGLAARTAA